MSFEESIFGGQREFEVSCFETCDNCDGSGARTSSCIRSCTACGGRGGVMNTQRTPFGMMSQVNLHTKTIMEIDYFMLVAHENFPAFWVQFS